MEGTGQKCLYEAMYIGPEGVAAPTLLTPDQEYWYRLKPESRPHVTLAVAKHHTAMKLGPMVCRATQVREWAPTDNPHIHLAPDKGLIRVSFPQTASWGVAERVERDRPLAPEDVDTPSPLEAEDPDVKIMLDGLPQNLWATGAYDMGFTPQHNIQIPLNPDQTPIHQPQYKVRPEAEAGITATVQGLKEAGVLRPSQSLWNTPILPVKKADGLTWRMAHDLRLVNDATEGPPERVPNPHVALHVVSPDHLWFSAIDLANAFFCIPLNKDSQDIFSFTWRGEKLTYTRMPQGYRSTPTIFNDCVRKDLKDTVLPDGVVMVQYVDDILLAAPTRQACVDATKTLLETLGKAGYKVKRPKLQAVRPKVKFLGRLVGGDTRDMTQDTRETILNYPKPATVQQMLAFLGLCNYSRQYLPEFTERTSELRQMVTTAGARNLRAPLEWDSGKDTAFHQLKQALHSAAALQAPDYTTPFHLDVTQRNGNVAATLWQAKPGTRRILLYHSSALPTPGLGLPHCARHLMAIAIALRKTQFLTMNNPTVVHTTHGVKAAVESSLFTLSAAITQIRLTEALTDPSVSYSTKGVNMTGEYPADTDGTPHNCTPRILSELRARPDLQGSPLETPKTVWYTDGCCYKDALGTNIASWAVVEQGPTGVCHTRHSGILPEYPSAQRAELTAMVVALEAAKGLRLDLYTDSNYVYELCHLNATQAERRGMLTSTGAPLKHRDLVVRLLLAIQLPESVAIIKCQGHTKGDSLITRGNNAADAAAKKAGGYTPPLVLSLLDPLDGEPYPRSMSDFLIYLGEMQEHAGPYEKSCWIARGCTQDESEIYRYSDGKPALSSRALSLMARSHHSRTHQGTTATMETIRRDWWHPEMKASIQEVIKDCHACQIHNPRPAHKPPRGIFPVPQLPFQELYIDYTDMGLDNHAQGKRYLLVIVDRFTKWVEAFPTKREDSASVVKILLNDIIPRWGYPKLLCSDNGSHFSNAKLQEVEAALGIAHRFGSVYHPQSQGLVERANRTLKSVIAKAVHPGDTGPQQQQLLQEELAGYASKKKMSWIEALPLALFSVRSHPSSRCGLSPFELVTGRPMPGPHSPPRGPVLDHYDEALLEYVQALTLASRALYTQVTSLPTPADPDPVLVNPGDWVWVRVHKRQCLQPRWEGPYKVLLATPFSVSLSGKSGARWHHLSTTRKADNPHDRTLATVQRDLARLHHEATTDATGGPDQ